MTAAVGEQAQAASEFEAESVARAEPNEEQMEHKAEEAEADEVETAEEEEEEEEAQEEEQEARWPAGAGRNSLLGSPLRSSSVASSSAPFSPPASLVCFVRVWRLAF